MDIANVPICTRNASSDAAIAEDIDQVAIKPANAPYFAPLNVTINSLLFLRFDTM